MRYTQKSEVFSDEYKIAYKDGESTLKNTVAAVNKLGRYEDAEEQGLQMYVPCKCGDTVWYLYKHSNNNYIAEAKVCGISTESYGNEHQVYVKVKYTDCKGNTDRGVGLFGKQVFLHEEEALLLLLKHQRKNIL